jgi:serine/threonine-protein kinase RsbW
VSIIVTDSGQGFDPNAVPDPLVVERLQAEHGRGIHLMKLAMDEVPFERGGTEVHMQKGLTRNPRTGLRSDNETASRRFGNSSESDECGDGQLQTRKDARNV